MALPSGARASERDLAVAGRRSRGAILGVVACGGASSRMGHDKARLTLDGEPLVVRAARVLAACSAEVALASGSPRFDDVSELRGLRELPDAVDGAVGGGGTAAKGPLAGLVAALEFAARADFGGVLYLACDLVRVDAAVLTPLARALQEGADVAYWTRDGRPEPLCAAYSVACAPVARAAFERGARRMVEPWAGTDLRVHELAASAEVERALENANTPEDGRRLGLSLPAEGVAL